MGRRETRWALLILAVGFLAAPVEAQSRGGRFGSSSWGRSSRSSGSRSSSGWRSSSRSGRSWSSGSGGSGSSSSPSPATPRAPSSAADVPAPLPYDTPPDAFGEPSVEPAEREARSDAAGLSAFWKVGAGSSCCFFFGLIVAAWAFGYRRASHVSLAGAPAPPLAGRVGGCEVRRLSIGFDASVRRYVQGKLDEMAAGLSLDGSEGRRRGASLLAGILDSALGGARYATFQAIVTDLPGAQAQLQQMSVDLNARYRYERGHAPDDLVARADEGEGLVVVSVLVATDAPMAPLPTNTDVASVRQALHALAHIGAPTVYALEVIWSPAEENDRMSSLELEGRYPELQRIDASPALGRVGCSYCHAPYPAEIGRCPACGAPGPAAHPHAT